MLCTPDYEKWLLERAERLETGPTALLEEALLVLAEVRGWPEPPARLYGR